MSPLTPFLDLYNKLKSDNLELLEEIYSADIRFCDPAHEISGITELKNYFAELYRNVRTIRFDFTHQLLAGSEACVQWRMFLSHPRLAGGREIVVDGVSRLRFDAAGKVAYQRDFFDLGAMLYEHLPLIGGVIRKIKQRLGQ